MAILNFQGFTQVYTRGSDYWQNSIPFRTFFNEWSKGKLGTDFTYEFGSDVFTSASPSVGLFGQNRTGTIGDPWVRCLTKMTIPSEIRSGKVYLGARINRIGVTSSQLQYPALAHILFTGSATVNGVTTTYWPTASTTETNAFVEIVLDYTNNSFTSYINGVQFQSFTLTSVDMLKISSVNFGSQYSTNPSNTSQTTNSLSGGTTSNPATLYMKDLYLVWDSVDDPNPTGRLGAVTIQRWLPSTTDPVNADWTFSGADNIAAVAASIDRKLFNVTTPGMFATSGMQEASYTAPVANIGTSPLDGEVHGLMVRSAASRAISSIPAALKVKVDYGNISGFKKTNLTAVNEIQDPLVMDIKPSDPIVDLKVTLSKEMPD